jgi:hypothetical protein
MGRVDNAEKIVKEMQDGFAELASRREKKQRQERLF